MMNYLVFFGIVFFYFEGMGVVVLLWGKLCVFECGDWFFEFFIVIMDWVKVVRVVYGKELEFFDLENLCLWIIVEFFYVMYLWIWVFLLVIKLDIWVEYDSFWIKVWCRIRIVEFLGWFFFELEFLVFF